MDQAQPTGEHRIYAQTCTCTNSSGFFSSLFLITFLCFSIRLAQLILLQRRFFGPRYIGDDFFLGVKQEGLTILKFLNHVKKLYGFLSIFLGVIFKLDSYFLFKLKGYFLYLTPIVHSMPKLGIHFRLVLSIY